VLLLKYGTLESLLRTGRLAREAEQLRLFRRIATMDAKAPLPAVRVAKPTWGRAGGLARSWGLEKLAERLERLASSKT
jgi:DNA polymerase-1